MPCSIDLDGNLRQVPEKIGGDKVTIRHGGTRVVHTSTRHYNAGVGDRERDLDEHVSMPDCGVLLVCSVPPWFSLTLLL